MQTPRVSRKSWPGPGKLTGEQASRPHGSRRVQGDVSQPSNSDAECKKGSVPPPSMPTVLESVEEEEDGPARFADVQHRLQEMQTRIVSDVEKKLQEYSARWHSDLADEVARQLSARFGARSPLDEICLKPLVGFRIPQVDSRSGSPVHQEPLQAPRLSTAGICPPAIRQRPCSPVPKIGVMPPRGEDSVADDALRTVNDPRAELQARFAAIKDLIQVNASQDVLRSSEKKGPDEATQSTSVPLSSATVAAVLVEPPKPAAPPASSGPMRHARSVPSSPSLSVGGVESRSSPAKSRSSVGARSRSSNPSGKGESRQLHAQRATSRELNDILERRRSISEGRVHHVLPGDSPIRPPRSAQQSRRMSLRTLGDDSPRGSSGR